MKPDWPEQEPSFLRNVLTNFALGTALSMAVLIALYLVVDAIL